MLKIRAVMILSLAIGLIITIGAFAQDMSVPGEINWMDVLTERGVVAMILVWLVYWFTRICWPQWVKSQQDISGTLGALNTTLLERQRVLTEQDELLRQVLAAVQGCKKNEVV